MSLEAPPSNPFMSAPETMSELPPMPMPLPAEPERIPLWQRGMLCGVGLILITLLIVAACLPPNPNGMGTHQSLGLPPCSFVLLFDMRCPACGMTTSWAHFVRGQIIQSAQANTGGMLLAMLAATLGPWMLASGFLGRWWIGALNPAWLLAGGSVIFFVTAVQWCGRVFF